MDDLATLDLIKKDRKTRRYLPKYAIVYLKDSRTVLKIIETYVWRDEAYDALAEMRDELGKNKLNISLLPLDSSGNPLFPPGEKK